MPDWTRVTLGPVSPDEARPTCDSVVRTVAHVCFHVADLDASVAFYRDILGLPPSFWFYDEHGERFGVYIHVGERTFLELFQGKPQSGNGHPSYAHFCIEVPDLEAAVEAIQARGGTTLGEPKVGRDGSGQAWLTDPDGNRIELHHYTAESLQLPFVSK